MNLTVAFITSRYDPRLQWFLDSLRLQMNSDEEAKIIVVDSRCAVRALVGRTLFTPPKPTIWQGAHRITKEDWWAKSNALNTAICLCKTDWIAFVDDRCVLGPQWMEAVRDAMLTEYAVCGSYEKRANMRVVNGMIEDAGELLGEDTRPKEPSPRRSWDWYGGSGALPLEWCLEVQGFSEDLCDGLGSEDSMFGSTLKELGKPMCYDARMRLIEDRTPHQIDGALKRADKGVSPNDKSHAIVRALHGMFTSQNSFDIRNMRDRVLAGEPFPAPSASHIDWFDWEPIAEME